MHFFDLASMSILIRCRSRNICIFDQRNWRHCFQKVLQLCPHFSCCLKGQDELERDPFFNNSCPLKINALKFFLSVTYSGASLMHGKALHGMLRS